MKRNKAKYRISGNAIVLLPYYGYGRGGETWNGRMDYRIEKREGFEVIAN